MNRWLFIAINILYAIALFGSQQTISRQKQIILKKEKVISQQAEMIGALQNKIEQMANIQQELGIFDIRKVNHVQVTVTSYNPTPSQGWGNGLKTCTGQLVAPGVISVSHDLLKRFGIKLGQKVVLGKYGLFIVGDTMNKRFTQRVDIISFVPAWSKAFGVKHAKLYYEKI